MPKLAALTALLALTWGCAQRSAGPAEVPSNSSTSSVDSQGDGHSSPAAEPQALPPEATPMPTPTPSGENNTEEPADNSQKLAQARAMGCVGIR